MKPGCENLTSTSALIRARILIHDTNPRLDPLSAISASLYFHRRFSRLFFFSNYTHRTQFIVGGNGEVLILQCTPFFPLLGDPRRSLTAP